jgi:acyl-CoA thioester hydrolase
MSHKITFRVYYEDTDAGGVVYYGNYLRFAERARTEWLRELGYNQSEMEILFVVKKVEIDYLFPARLDDEVEVQTSVMSVSRASLTMEQNFFANGKHLAKMVVVLVSVTREIKVASLPQEFRNKITEK